jgi:hypothetical protein
MVATVGFWCLAESLLRVRSCELGDLVSMYGCGLSWDDRGCRQKRRKACGWAWNLASGGDRVVVNYGWWRCCVKHPERTHVNGGMVTDSVESVNSLQCIIHVFLILRHMTS